MRKDTLILVEGVTKRYRKVHALREFSLEVTSGMICSLLGPNGAGKTTLMKILLGLVRIDEGSVSILNLAVSSPLSRKGVRYLPETVTFPAWATPRALFRMLERIRCESSMPEFELRCRELECFDLLGRPVGKMSRGQRQRVALSLVTAGRSDLVLLDEPSSGLDPGGRILVRNLIKNLASEGSTVLINSHLLGEVERICDNAVFINNGCMIATGELDGLSRQTGHAFVETQAPDEMKACLEREGYSCRKEEKGISAGLEDPSLFRKFTEAVLSTGIAFSELRLMRENLEDVFLRLMEDSEGRDVS